MGILVKRYIWIVNLIFVLALSYILAQVTSLMIASYFTEENFVALTSQKDVGVFTKSTRSLSIEAIIARNFFDAQDSGFAANTDLVSEDVPEADPAVQTTGVAVKTTLPVTLISTVVFGNGEDQMSSCVLLANNDSTVFGVGDALGFPQTQLVRILPKRIEFSNKGRLEYVEILDDVAVPSFSRSSNEMSQVEPVEEAQNDDAEPTDEVTGIEQQGNHFLVKASLVQDALKEPDNLYSQVRATQYYENGKQAGFKFFKVSPKSIFHQLGIRRGDVVKSVNGKTLDIQTGMQVFSELKDLKNFEMDLVRKGAEQKFTYEIVD